MVGNLQVQIIFLYQPYYLDLLNYRDVSGSITKQLDIEHQSPQMLVLKGGVVLGVSNHSEINVDEVKKHL